jgi:hypothetical protein
MYADNARPHTARLSIEFFEDNEIRTAPHRPYSPDIAPFNFCLFGDANGCLAGRPFVDAEEVFEAVREILDSIDKVTLQVVFLAWMDRPGQ